MIFPSLFDYTFTLMDDRERLINLIRTRSFEYSDSPSFKLTAGGLSNFYFNLKKTTYSPEGQYLIGKILFNLINELELKVDAIGGLTMGADPIACAVACQSFGSNMQLEAFSIRKEPKAHGMMLAVEGYVKKSDRVIIIDDVITTGSSTIKAIKAAQDYGLDIVSVIVIVDRCEFNGRGNIESYGYKVHSITDINDFIKK